MPQRFTRLFLICIRRQGRACAIGKNALPCLQKRTKQRGVSQPCRLRICWVSYAVRTNVQTFHVVTIPFDDFVYQNQATPESSRCQGAGI